MEVLEPPPSGDSFRYSATTRVINYAICAALQRIRRGSGRGTFDEYLNGVEACPSRLMDGVIIVRPFRLSTRRPQGRNERDLWGSYSQSLPHCSSTKLLTRLRVGRRFIAESDNFVCRSLYSSDYVCRVVFLRILILSPHTTS